MPPGECRARTRPQPTVVVLLTTSIDRAAPPSRIRTLLVHRLNRTEYGNAVRDLLALNVDVTACFPR
jgi:hypothetical protein